MNSKKKDQEAAEAAIEFQRRKDLEAGEETGEESTQMANLRRFAYQRLDDHWFRGLRMLSQYPGNKLMALDCFLLAHGKGEMIEVPVSANPRGKPVDAVMVAIKHFADPKKKAAVTKCVKHFQDCLGLPPMPGQRGENGRKNMAVSRNEQLKT
jgi:hypothetical protein